KDANNLPNMDFLIQVPRPPLPMTELELSRLKPGLNVSRLAFLPACSLASLACPASPVLAMAYMAVESIEPIRPTRP
ncbi:MAG TPA: hypothetical protein PKA06_07990, partial [Gemmatales bacterium]|nr:hypothetical protein [Gemmatales bacterium]